ncbi:MAG: hypothetical protein ACHQYP_06730 [Nitrospiria bacterium]
MNRPKNQYGFALLSAIFLLVVIGFVGVVFISLSSSNGAQSVNELNSSRALYLAEAGLERAQGFLSGDDPSCPGGGCICASINSSPALFSAVSLGAGQFTVTSVQQGGQCVLTSTGGVPTIASGTAQRVVTYAMLTTIQDAWTVGYNVNLGGGNNRPFMAHWNGTAWSNTTATAPTIGPANNPASLMEVSMASSNYGWAVSNQGDFINYNGISWSYSAAFNATVGLNSIYMNSTTDGWAVGNSGQIDHWNGTAWSIYPYTAKNNGTTVTLLGVYCINSTFCWTVGNRIGGGLGQGSIFLWNGTNWSFSASPTVSGANLRYVTCVDTSHCWAVGSSGGEIIFWNGTSWTYQDKANDSLWGVDCVDTSNCWTVGRNGGIIYYNGTSWAAQTSPTNQWLTFVSCVTSKDCWASGAGGTLIHWNGTNWSLYSGGGGWPTSQLNSMSQFRSGNSAISWQESFQ